MDESTCKVSVNVRVVKDIYMRARNDSSVEFTPCSVLQ